MSLHEEKMKDIEYIEQSTDGDEYTPEEEKALVRKVDLYLLPTVWIMYLLSYMDVRRKSFYMV